MLRVNSEAARQLFRKPFEEGHRILLNARGAYYCRSIGCQGTDTLSDALDGSKAYSPLNQHTPFPSCNQAAVLEEHSSRHSSLRSESKIQSCSQHGCAPALLSGSQTGSAESVSQTGLSTSATSITSRVVSQTLHEHLDSSSLGALSGSLSNTFPRPPTQPAAKPCCQPKLHLWKHGPAICDVALPAACLNVDTIPDLTTGAVIANHLGVKNILSATTSRAFGGSLDQNVGFVCFGAIQMRHWRGFRTGAGGSMSLDEEKEESEVAVADQKADAVTEKKEKYGPRRSQRIPRSVIGNYDEEFEDELDLAESSPWQDPLYNLRPRVDQFLMKEMGVNPHLDLEDLVAEADDRDLVSAIPDEYAGLPLVLRWETRFVLAPGPSAYHPLNRKVKVQCYLRDLGLSEAARERMIALVGKRYDARRDELTLISQRYSHREENRKDVLRILYELIDESNRADTEGEKIAAMA